MKSSFSMVFFCTAITITATIIFAQPNPDTLWSRTYGGTGWDEAYSVQQTTDGGYLVGGCTASFGGATGFYLVKTDSVGGTLWTHNYGGSWDDWCYAVRQTSDGGYIVAGESVSFGPTFFSNVYLVKTNSLGDTLWTHTYGGDLHEGANSVQQTADGGYIAAGYTTTFGAGSYDIYLVKTTVTGDTMWTRAYGGNSTEIAFSVQPTNDGGYIIAGQTSSSGAGSQDFYLVKTNSSGDLLWTRTFGGLYTDIAYSVLQTDDGGYIVAGYTDSFGENPSNVYLVKTNSQGDSLWTRVFGENRSSDQAYSIQQTSDGGYIIAGYTWFSDGGSKDCYLVKVNSQGELLWTRTYGGSNLDHARFAQQTSDGGYVLAGKSSSFGEENGDFYLLKTGPDPGSNIDPDHILQPLAYTLSCYPNPFNATAAMVFELPRGGYVSLRVFDLIGREVGVLNDGFCASGTHQVMFDGNKRATGIYFVRLDAGAFSRTTKLMLIK